MDTMKRYEEHSICKLLRWSGILVGLTLTVMIMPMIFNQTIEDINSNNYKNFDFIAGLIYLIISPIFLYALLVTFIEFYTVAVKVELTEEKIIGYPWYGKKKFEIRYDEIEIIKDRSNIFPILAITLLGKTKKMYISIYVYPLADVVGEIEKRAIHLKESRLKKLKRDSTLWLHGKEEEK